MKKFNWGWRIIAAFAVFMIGTSAWVAYAMSTEVDLVRPDYYEASLKEDQTKAALNHGAESHAGLELKNQTLTVTVPQSGATGTIVFYRPNSPASDRTITLKLDEHGTMSIPTSELAAGIWRITLEWKCGGTTYELLKSVTL